MDVLFTQEFLMFFLFGVIGMFAHWAKRWARKQTKLTLYQYLFVKDKKYTIYAFMTYVGAIIPLAATVTADFDSLQALALAFTTGYTIDSAINKDEHHVQSTDASD